MDEIACFFLMVCVCVPPQAGEASQTETVSEENKSLIWTLLKQVRPGMDLSKVVLPTFILEPRSFLDKLSDYYYHADFLSEWVSAHKQHRLCITFRNGVYSTGVHTESDYPIQLGHVYSGTVPVTLRLFPFFTFSPVCPESGFLHTTTPGQVYVHQGSGITILACYLTNSNV